MNESYKLPDGTVLYSQPSDEYVKSITSFAKE